ncbi:MAG: AAA family ATPase [Candidatus Schekmanbacteria bacterium]|nr:AAA family ATPase [Candidatus Schekmanbacteria bacterium]
MFLKKLSIKKFRCIENLTLDFHKGVNILIGENNSGKTAIIDALRICFSYGNQYRDTYVAINDFFIDTTSPSRELTDIEFDLIFEIVNDEKAGIFYDMLSVGEERKKELQLHFRYSINEKSGSKKVRYKVWGGENEGQSVAPEVLELIYAVYLGPLRDAVQSLRPVKGNILGDLYSNIEQDSDKQQCLAGKVHNLLQDDTEWRSLINSGKDAVNEHIKKTSILGKQYSVDIEFLPFEFRRILDTLRIQIPIYDNLSEGTTVERKYFNLAEYGLGYNNLIYMAVVLGNLTRRKEVEADTYISLLLEEPEAHLHPQLQNILFAYLNEINDKGIQIFITSHSPTITAKANLDSLIVLQNQDKSIYSLPLINSNLDENNRKYLQKFLDVTKSQFFFSSGVILVEGISEALLLPVFSRIMGKGYNLEKNGIEIVNINGVAFEHFGKLFNPELLEQGLRCRCAILTDDDLNRETDEISSRAKKAKDLEKSNLKVELAKETFEFELFMAGNKDLLLSIFNEMHPRAAQNITEGNTIEEHSRSFVDKVISNKAKSELSHRLSVLLAEREDIRNNFTVPEYIQNAIRWVVKGE